MKTKTTSWYRAGSAGLYCAVFISAAIFAPGSHGEPEDSAGSQQEASAEGGAFEATTPITIPYDDATKPPAGAQPKEGKGEFDLGLLDKWMQPSTDSTAENGETNTDGGSDVGLSKYARAFGALAVVLALCILGAQLLRRYSGYGVPWRTVAPSQVLGRQALTPQASLHFIRAGGRILVVGVCPNHIALLTEFDAESFDEATSAMAALQAEQVMSREEEPRKRAGFLTFMQRKRPEKPSTLALPVQDDDIESLRGDINRLQQYLKEASGRDRVP